MQKKSRFGCLDRQLNWKFTFFVLCLTCFFENLIISGSATVVLSTIEREFFLTSTESGFFLGIYELAGFVAAPIFGFFGSSKRINKMKLISLSLFLVTVGAYIIGFTVFLKEPYLNFASDPTLGNLNKTNTNLCHFNQNHYLNSTNECADDIEIDIEGRLPNSKLAPRKVDFLLYIGHLIIGFGGVAIYRIGIAYIEEITHATHSPYCQAIFYGTGSIGGGLGFLITGQFLNINARFYMGDDYEPNKWITPSNTYWIGAWWLTYVIYGSICALLFVLVFLFSFRSFDPSSKQTAYKTTNVNQPEQAPQKRLTKFERLLKKPLYDFLRKMKTTLTNFKLVFIILSTVTEGVILKGFLGFMSKYVEYQFDMPASISTVITGAIALVSVLLGTLISAHLINKFSWKTKDLAVFTTAMFFVTSFCFLILLNHCPEVKFTKMSSELCSNCDCPNKYNPICLHENFTKSSGLSYVYQSPCHAGCKTQISENKFKDCECIVYNSTLNDQIAQANVVLSAEYCDSSIKCVDKLVINGFAALLIVFLTAMSIVPHIKAAIGCVSEELQTFSLGVRSAIVSLIGNFIGTVLIGKAVDMTCKYWLKDCLNQEVCKLYDNNKMSVTLSFIGFGFRVTSGVFMLIAVFFIIREERRTKKTQVKKNLETTKF